MKALRLTSSNSHATVEFSDVDGGELRLGLRIDRLGHVALSIRIRSDPGGADPWQLDAELGLEAGQLECIAGDADRLWRAGS